MIRSAIFFPLLMFLHAVAFAATVSDEELLEKTVYELELIPRKDLSKDQRKLVKSLIKTNRERDCSIKQNEFFEMPLEELQALDEKKMSKSERKMYSFIRKNREKLADIIQIPSFKVTEDDFEETSKFATTWTKETRFDKNKCPFSSWNWRQAGTNSTKKWFARGTIGNGGQGYLQFYLRFSPQHFANNQFMTVPKGFDSKWYYGVTKIVGKGYGALRHVMIDYNFEVTEGATKHLHDIGIYVSKTQLKEWYDAGEDISIRIYSQSGQNVDAGIPYPQIKVFYDGLLDTKIWDRLII